MMTAAGSVARWLRTWPLLLWSVSSCSSGGAPSVDDPVPFDLSQPDVRFDMTVPDMATGPASTCETPCWLNPLPQGNYFDDVWRDGMGNGWAVAGNSLVRIEGDRAVLVRHPAWQKQNFLEQIWGSGPSDVWVVGTAVLHFDGKTWTELPEYSWKGIHSVWGSGPKDVWMVGIQGQIHHFDGTSWTKMTSPVTTALFQVSGSSGSNVWIGGEAGTLLYYNGSSFTKQTLSLGGDIGSLSCAPSGECWLVPFAASQNSGTTLYRLEGGRWVQQTAVPSGTYYGVEASASSEVWLTGTRPMLFNGSTWTQLMFFGTLLTSISGVGGPLGREQLGVGIRGYIGRWNGSSWRQISSGEGSSLRAVYSSPQGDVFAAGQSGSILRIRGGKLEWGGIAGDSTIYAGIWGTSSSDVWAVGDYGRVSRFDGTTWTAVPQRFGGSLEKLVGVSGTSSSDVWIVGDSGTVVHYNGTSYASQTLSLGLGKVAAVWASAANDVWISGENGRLGHYDGSKWSLWPKTLAAAAVSLWGSGPSDVWATGGWDVGKNIYLSRYNGSTWEAQTLPANSTFPASITGTGPLDIWLGGHYGELAHWDGASWKSVPLGTNFEISGVGRSGNSRYAVGDSGLVIQMDGY